MENLSLVILYPYLQIVEICFGILFRSPESSKDEGFNIIMILNEG